MRKQRYGQYVDVSRSEIVGHNSIKYRVIIYGAYDAFGLIGSEYNGIAVLDEDHKRVICDGIATSSFGPGTPTKAQLELFKRLVLSDYADFREYLTKHENYRGGLPAAEERPVFA